MLDKPPSPLTASGEDPGAAGDRPLSYGEVYRQTRKPLDAWWIVFVTDHLATPIVYLIQRLGIRVSPNWITFVSLLFGLGGCYAFACSWWITGAILYQVSFTLDCVDGRIARLRKLSSPIGAWWDGFVNHVVYVACVAGIVLSDPGNCLLCSGGMILLAMRSLTIFTNHELDRPDEGTWSHFVASEDSWMSRMRLLPPGSFPDKHAVLFFAGPLLVGFAPGLQPVLIGVGINVAMEIMLLALKIRKLLRQDELASARV